MSLTLIIAINAVADAALAVGLAYTMSRAARLTPHASARAIAPGPQLATSGDARRSRSARRAADVRTRASIVGRAGGRPAAAHE
jgi:hypothetical protein